MKPGQRPRYPRPQSIMRALETLKLAVPTDQDPMYEWRTSHAGSPNLRVKATTRDIEWVVDIYCGHYYRTQVGNSTGEVWRTLPGLIGYLRKMLGLGPL